MRIQLLLITSLLSFNLLADTKKSRVQYLEDRYYKIKKKKSDNQANYSLSVAYLRSTSDESNDDQTEISNGVSLRAAKVFQLTETISTSTAILGNYSILEDYNISDLGIAGDVEGNEIEVGLSQRLSLALGNEGTFLRPFVEASIYKGKTTYNLEDSSLGTQLELEASANYLKYSGSIGFEIVINNKITPFVKYELSQMKYDSDASVEYSFNGTSSSYSQSLSDDEDKTQRIMVGIGILF